MLDILLKLVQQNAQDSVVNNKQVPDQYNQGVQEEVTNSIFSSLSGIVSSGKTNELIQLIGTAAGKGSNIASNPIVKSVINNVVDSLGKKFNISPQVSKTIALQLIPQVLAQFSKKIADPEDKTIDMNNVIDLLLNNKGSSKSSSGGIDFNGALGELLSGSGKGGFDFGKMAQSILGDNTPKKSKSTKSTATSKKTTTTINEKNDDLLGGLLDNFLK